jgi:hypothetical protein
VRFLPSAMFGFAFATSLSVSGCYPLSGSGKGTGYAAIVRGRVISGEGAAVAAGCEAGTSMDGLHQDVRSLGARALQVPDLPGKRYRLTLRFQDVETELPEPPDPNDDAMFCDTRYITQQRSRPLPLGCHAALRVVGPNPPAEIRNITAIIEDDGEAGFVVDLTVRHAGVLRVRAGAPCPVHDDFEILTIGARRSDLVIAH